MLIVATRPRHEAIQMPNRQTFEQPLNMMIRRNTAAIHDTLEPTHRPGRGTKPWLSSSLEQEFHQNDAGDRQDFTERAHTGQLTAVSSLVSQPLAYMEFYHGDKVRP
ncbi:hypothetical protein [Microvirga ossetica]|uniref:hypothetical protein n=1 Tax=Microvirga ossetica TaxID=1882682 RepID=UPI001300050A|nr:hypothetical protein [Microvirga ossetica]